jgi:hypothetical protein
MFRGPATGGDNFHFHSLGSVPVVLGDKQNGIEVFCRSRSKLKRRIHPSGINRSARRCRNMSTAASPSINSPRSAWAKPFSIWARWLRAVEDPVFQIELLADDLKSLIENLAGIPIRAGLDPQLNDALLFGFEVNGHGSPLSKGIFFPHDPPTPPLLPAST